MAEMTDICLHGTFVLSLKVKVKVRNVVKSTVVTCCLQSEALQRRRR